MSEPQLKNKKNTGEFAFPKKERFPLENCLVRGRNLKFVFFYFCLPAAGERKKTVRDDEKRPSSFFSPARATNFDPHGSKLPWGRFFARAEAPSTHRQSIIHDKAFYL
jgi:hypothetical protein